MSGIVSSPDDVSIEWLTERLNTAGHRGRVTGYRAERIGTGQIGLCVRFTLQVEGGNPRTPVSLVGKFPSRDAQSRATGVALRNYLKEVSFYREMQSKVAIRTPRCYYAEIDGEGPEFGLLLEDLYPATQGDQLRGCSLEVAHAAVQQLVGLHGPTWRREQLKQVGWIGAPTDADEADRRDLYALHLPGFLERYGSRLMADEVAILRRYAETMPQPFPSRFSLLHVDYRLDNLLIDTGVSPPAVTVVDWQSVTLGNPMTDVAYFLGAGMLPDARRRAEVEIVSDYHAALVSHGINDYAWEDCWQDYRRAAFHGFNVTVIASMLVGRTERGDEMFIAMARRHARHAIELNSLQLLR